VDLVSNFKIEIKNEASMNCDFDVTTLVSRNLKAGIGVESEFDIKKISDRTRVGIELVGVGVESEPEIGYSDHLCTFSKPCSSSTHYQPQLSFFGPDVFPIRAPGY